MNLTKKQYLAYDKMINGFNVFLTGPGGTGKSYLLKHFINYKKNTLKKNDKYSLVVTSTTGLSSSLINGVTLHSWAGIGTGEELIDVYYDKIKNNSLKLNNWLYAKILIIDEISMLNPELFQRLDLLGRKLRNNDKPFGGIQIILSGDFCQLPTVNSHYFCFEALNWNSVIDYTFYLNENLRLNNSENIFQNSLNEIRLGIVSEETKNLLKSRIKSRENIFGIIPTTLYPIKKKVKEYNEKKLKELLDKNIDFLEYNAEYKYSKTISNDQKIFLKDCIDKNKTIDNYIKLCIGAQVIVNVSIPSQNLYNGSRGIIIGFDKNLPIVKFLDGKEKTIELYKWELDYGTIISKIQIPLILGWAMTIHKSQGMTLDYVYTDIGDSIFEYGQTYVVLSRVKSLESLFLKNIDFSKIFANPKVIDYYNSIN